MDEIKRISSETKNLSVIKDNCTSYKEIETYRFRFGKYVDQFIWDVVAKDPQ